MDLCRGCHADKVNAILAKSRVHQAVVQGDACRNCHTPHASKTKGLLRGSTESVCGACHADTLKRGAAAAAKHKPVADGQCGACHDPHSGDAPPLLARGSVVELCGTCHDWLKHSSHPMGEKVKDMRNPNLTLQCLSCHRGHGTEHKRLLTYATQPELCVKCHEKYQR